ncbi:hypothetical protein GCM10010149_86630 [Nonomuraea roseoviolacea subsp. roseoviolacea]|uniref:hypothetical protein n=1 Tax=Nonomuraea roseoviolacea TaxID=103837 RepID=UPI0031E43FDF
MRFDKGGLAAAALALAGVVCSLAGITSPAAARATAPTPTLAPAPAPGSAPVALAAPVAAGYANVSGTLPTGSWTPLAAGDVYSSAGQGVSAKRSGQGVYEVQFPGLGTALSPGVAVPGVVQAHSTLSGLTACVPSGVPSNLVSGVLWLTVKCFDGTGKLADPFSFTVTYTRGGTEAGRLGTVRLSQDDIAQLVAAPTATVTPAEQFSVGGPITVRRDPAPNANPGFFNLAIPRDTGARPHAIDVSAAGGTPGVLCNVTGAAPDPLNDKIEKVRVACHNNNGTAVDTPLNLSYAEDVNTLGKAGALSYAYLTPPPFSAGDGADQPVAVPAAQQRDVFRGVPGRVTFEKLAKGHFQVFLENQNLQRGHLGAVSVVPLGNSSANKVCGVADDVDSTDPLTGAPARKIRFVCGDRITGTLWDHANFQLGYTARQQ